MAELFLPKSPRPTRSQIDSVFKDRDFSRKVEKIFDDLVNASEAANANAEELEEATTQIKIITDAFVMVDNFYPAATDHAAVTAGLAQLSSLGGGTLWFSGREYNLNFSGASLLSINDSVVLKGMGDQTILNISGAGIPGAKTVFFTRGPGIRIEDMTINFDVDNGQAFALRESGLVVSRCKLNGGHTDTNTTTFHGFELNGSGDLDGLEISGCEITNFRYGLLRSNGTTGAFRRIRILNNLWENNYANHLALNSPNAVMDDVLVQGNTFGDCPGGDAFGTFANMLGMASVTNYRVIGNHFEGICKDAIHLEEAGGNIVVSGNTFTALDKGANTNGGRGIYCVDNHIGGGAVGPTRVVISNNTLQGVSDTDSDFGIYFVRSTIYPGTKYTIADNTIDSFETGIEVIQDYETAVRGNTITNCVTGISLPDDEATLRTGAIVSGNLIASCDVGLDCDRGWPTIERNVFRDCTVGIQTDRPGMFGYQTFRDCTTPGTSSGEPLSLLGWHFEVTEFSIAATPTNTQLDMLTFPGACNGRLTLTAGRSLSTGTWISRVWSVDIAGGGVVTASLLNQRTSGPLATTGPPADNAGLLSVTLTNADVARSDVFYQATFEGMYALD